MAACDTVVLISKMLSEIDENACPKNAETKPANFIFSRPQV